jgi:16S rRNA (guanine1207-N2)-methyltransferase
VALRLPRAKDELEMTAHAAAGALAPGGRLLVYGATDEGIKSAPGRVGSAFGSVTSVATGGRCRIVEARDPGTPLRDTLEAWAFSFDPGVEGVAERWRSYPGVFAHGRVDGGTRLLLEHLPPVEPGQRVVDFGCGHGIVGARVLAREPAAEVTFVDVDAVALEAVRSNLGPVAVRLSDGWGSVALEPVDHVVSNPPYHAGKGESLAVIRELVEGAARRLPARGTLTLVVQRRLPVETLLSPSFARVEAVADDGPWRVWRATGARGRTRGA